jgi:hypothetical protein
MKQNEKMNTNSIEPSIVNQQPLTIIHLRNPIRIRICAIRYYDLGRIIIRRFSYRIGQSARGVPVSIENVADGVARFGTGEASPEDQMRMKR